MTLNLVYPHLSEIKFKHTLFPDGQQDITLTLPENASLSGQTQTGNSWSISVTIQSRFNSFKDLEKIICATKALRGLGVKTISLYIPYLLGSRSDRRFIVGGTSYLVEVIAPILNAQGYEKIITQDVHSDVAAACIHNLEVVSNLSLVSFALADIHESLSDEEYVNHDFFLISPDAGALKKIYKVAESINYTNDVIVCSKYRDTNGKLSKVSVPFGKHWNTDKSAVIIDDICDGGRTFINIAKEMKDNGYKGKIYLIVTHGIFSAGFKELSKYFDGIYTTNSINDLGEAYFDGNRVFSQKVKQLNLFQ